MLHMRRGETMPRRETGKGSALTALTGLALMLAPMALRAQTEGDIQTGNVSGIETACTGTTDEARNDPRWKDYSLRLEFVGAHGQYLGDEQVAVSGAKSFS